MLLIFTAVVSVLLAGVSMVAFFAVPGMGLAMEELPDYSFEAQAGETITWNVTRRLGDQGNVVSGVNAFDAVLKARTDMERGLQDDTNDMTGRLSTVNKQLELFKAEQQQDVEAMTARVTQLESVAAEYEQQVRDKSGEFQDVSDQARRIRDETARRRQDVARLQVELEELRTHQFELRELRRTLTDQLLRIGLDNQNLQQREDEIRQQLVP